MKYMAKKSYSKKGDAVVEMNYKAIDAGVDALVKYDVPDSWKTASAEKTEPEITGDRPELVKFVKTIVDPVSKMLGDTLPVSAFGDSADGTYPQGACRIREARRRRFTFRNGSPKTASSVTSAHLSARMPPSVRSLLNEEEAAGGSRRTPDIPQRPSARTLQSYKFTMAVSPLDCMGCGLCVKVCPVTAKAKAAGTPEKAALEMKSRRRPSSVSSRLYSITALKTFPRRSTLLHRLRQGQPVRSSRCLNSPAPAQAVPRPLTHVSSLSSSARECISRTLPDAPPSGAARLPLLLIPSTVSQQRGPAWGNSLFEDNAEHGLGIYLGQKTIQKPPHRLRQRACRYRQATMLSSPLSTSYLDTVDDGAKNDAATTKLVCRCSKTAAANAAAS